MQTQTVGFVGIIARPPAEDSLHFSAIPLGLNGLYDHNGLNSLVGTFYDFPLDFSDERLMYKTSSDPSSRTHIL